MQALCSLRPWVLGPDLMVLYQINTHKSVMSKPSYLLISYCSDNFYLKGQSVYWDTELLYWSHLHILWMNTAILFDVQGRGQITCQYDQRLACLWICSDLHLVNRNCTHLRCVNVHRVQTGLVVQFTCILHVQVLLFLFFTVC